MHGPAMMNVANRCVVAEWHENAWDAQISRALLESEGIPAFLENEHHVTANWPMSRMLGGVRLMVPATFLDAAKATFSLRDEGTLQAALAIEFPLDDLACSKCGSTAFSDKRDWAGIALVFILLLKMAIIFPPRKVRRCNTCDQTQ